MPGVAQSVATRSFAATTPLSPYVYCSRIHNIIPVDDYEAALSQVDEVVDSRLELLQSHCKHRFCPVRATIRQFESGLEGSRQFMRDIVNRIFEIPDAVTAESEA